jgi:peroxiredoxin
MPGCTISVETPSTQPNSLLEEAMISPLPGKNTVMISILAAFLLFFTASAHCAETPRSGSVLPEFKIQAPVQKDDREYLGLGESDTFSLKKVGTRLVLVEIVGVFCPQCHAQAPLFNALYHRIRKNSDLDPRVRMLAIAAGATPMEADYMRKQFNIPYPILLDSDFSIHKLLGEPRTPFTMLVTPEGKVEYAHVGVITDMDEFYARIQKLVQ